MGDPGVSVLSDLEYLLLIATIRTDLDSFSDAESAVLQNHDYLMADVAVSAHARQLLPSPTPAAVAPFPEWLPKNGDDSQIRAALKDSSKRKTFGH